MKQVDPKNIQIAKNILSPKVDSKLVTHLNSCVHCGLCGTSCLFYKSYEIGRAHV